MTARARASAGLPGLGAAALLAALSSWLAGAPPAAGATRVFPLPMYTTTPNEGSTYGVMPVIVTTEGDGAGGSGGSGSGGNGGSGSGGDASAATGAATSGRVQSIMAPSASWNPSAHVTATFRYYRYFDALGSWRVIASYSTQINRTVWFQYDDDRRDVGRITKNIMVRVRRNLFYRYFGLGPLSNEHDESSYTRTSGVAAARWGWNLTRNLNLALVAELRGDWPERHAISGLPESQSVFPDAPGMSGATIARQGMSVRFDTREQGDYSEHGLATEFEATVAEGVTGAGPFGQLLWQTRLVVPETTFLQLAARFYWKQVVGRPAEVPFYYQASLGGELLLRGFPEDRFIDMGAWEVEVEQRLRLLELNLFGVVTQWRIDPFVAAGQVYGSASTPWEHVRVAAGVGLRLWIKPNVLGRLDVAYAGEGLRTYVTLGYPY